MNTEYFFIFLIGVGLVFGFYAFYWHLHRNGEAGQGRQRELEEQIGVGNAVPLVPDTHENIGYRARLRTRLDALESWWGFLRDNTPRWTFIALATALVLVPAAGWYYFGRAAPSAIWGERTRQDRFLTEAIKMTTAERSDVLVHPAQFEPELVVAARRVRREYRALQNGRHVMPAIPDHPRDAISFWPLIIGLFFFLVTPFGWVASLGDEAADAARAVGHMSAEAMARLEALMARLRAIRGQQGPQQQGGAGGILGHSLIAGFWRFMLLDVVADMVQNLLARLFRRGGAAAEH